jgi:ElaB/YqjD/DUF883 family membrane-anchored ribosome-binding protein
LYATFLTRFNDEDTALKKINKSGYTAMLGDKDKYRDELCHGLAEINKVAMLYHYDSEVRQAAKTNQIVFDTYGNVARMPFDNETQAIYNILQDFRGKYAVSAAKAGLTPWLNALEPVNNEFKSLTRERYGEATEKTDIVLRKARQRVDAAYNAIVERINAAIVIEGKDGYRDFVNALNTIIKKYADILAQRKGKAAAKKEKSENKD